MLDRLGFRQHGVPRMRVFGCTAKMAQEFICGVYFSKVNCIDCEDASLACDTGTLSSYFDECKTEDLKNVSDCLARSYDNVSTEECDGVCGF
jgi:hypothetical protein